MELSRLEPIASAESWELGSPEQQISLMVEGWEHLRRGHELLAEANAAPGSADHRERAVHASHRVSTLHAILEALEQSRRRLR